MSRLKQLIARWRRRKEISWLYQVWEFERESYATIVSRTYMRTTLGKKMVKRSRFWGCYRG
jgi:hypothetical protein